jgi:hypothetical protein
VVKKVVWCGVVWWKAKLELVHVAQLTFTVLATVPPVIRDAYRGRQGGRPGCGVGGEVIDPAMRVPRRLLFL